MLREPPVKRAVAFVDGQNLFHAAKQAFGHAVPRFDAQALARSVCDASGWHLVQLAATLEKRMQACAEHTLSAIPSAVKELERLSPGTGYVDLAGDLDGYADLYAPYPDEVRLDGVNYRDGDAAQGRKLAKQLLDALSAGLSDEARRWLDLTARAWTLLAGAYAEVSAAGWFLFRDDDAAGKFPSLYAAGRTRSGRGKKGKPKPTAPAPAGTGTPA
jgi:hypothetical protein